jgi:hypothetical protein
MSDISAPVLRPRSLVSETIRFYGMWIVVAVVLLALP